MSGTILYDPTVRGGSGGSATQYATAHAAWVQVQAQTSQYPSGAVVLSPASGNVANASAVATLTAAAGQTTYITSATFTGGGATAANLVTATITGLIGGTHSFTIPVPAGATLGFIPIVLDFFPPIPASAVNTAIVVTMPALGAGNTNATVTATGYRV